MEPPAESAGRGPASRRVQRDRHGRGMRGALLPQGLPAAQTRGETFDGLVLDAVEHLEPRWGAQLREVEFAVEEVPPADAGSVEEGVALAQVLPAHDRQPARIVVFRRPIEARARDPLDLADLIHDIVVEQVAVLLGLDPDVVDGGEEE